MKHTTRLQDWHVLVLEDSKTIGDELCGALRTLGVYHCTSVPSVAQAKRLYEMIQPQLTIIDHRLLGTVVGSTFALWLCANAGRAATIRVSYSSSDLHEIVPQDTPVHPPLYHDIVAKTATHAELMIVLQRWIPSITK